MRKQTSGTRLLAIFALTVIIFAFVGTDNQAAQPSQLTLSIDAVLNSVSPGQSVEYRIVAYNSGPQDLTGVVVSAAVPNYSGADGMHTAPIPDNSYSYSYFSSGTVLNWTLGTVFAGQSKTIYFSPAVNDVYSNPPPDGTTIGLTASAQSSGNASAVITKNITAHNLPSLTLRLAANSGTAVRGKQLKYVLDYGNESSSTFTNAKMTVPIPTGTTFVSSSDGILPVNGSLTWWLGDMPSSAAGTREFTVSVGNSLPYGSVIRSGATLSDAGVVHSTSASESTLLTSTAAFAVQITRTPASLAYQIAVSNFSAVDMADVQITSLVPNYTSLDGQNVSPVPDGYYSYSSFRTGSALTWTLGTLKARQTEYIHLTPNLNSQYDNPPPFAAVIGFSASGITGSGQSSHSSNDTFIDDFTFGVTEAPLLSTALTGGGFYESNTTVTLHAYPRTGYRFLNYTKNNAVVATTPGYQSVVSENRNLTVHLKPMGDADFNGDGKPDLIWQNKATGQRVIWLMNRAQLLKRGDLPTLGVAWDIVGTGDFNSDGRSDILLQNRTNGQRMVWIMDGLSVTATASLPAMSDKSWSMAGAKDFDGDGKPDIIWQNTSPSGPSSGQRLIWLMNGLQRKKSVSIGTVAANWTIVGSGDFNGDGRPDLLWQDKVTGKWNIWIMNGTRHVDTVTYPSLGTEWSIAGSGDFTGDGKADILWQNSKTGARLIWVMNGVSHATSIALPVKGVDWSVRNF